MSIRERLESMPKGMLIGGAVLLLVLMFAVAAYLMVSPKNTVPPSATSQMKSRADMGGVGGEGTPQYNQMIDALNEQKARDAAQKGDSYIPLPIGNPEELEPKTPPPPAIVKREPKAAPPVKRTAPRAAREGANKAFEADLKNIIQRTRTVVGQPYYVMVEAPEAGSASGQNVQGASRTTREPQVTVSKASVSEDVIQARAELRPGKILYAVNDLGINTDSPSPVMATVAAGPLKGAKAIGAFQRNGTTLVLAFTRLILTNGDQVSFSAVAIDPSTQQSDVASDYDTHFFSRWGSLIAASFLEGFGKAMQNKNQSTTVDTGNTVVVDSKEKSYSEITFEAFGKVGERSANILERNFDRPPTVYLNAGQPVGILIMEVSQ